jgi:Co/Zn/Cd efflux system component
VLAQVERKQQQTLIVLLALNGTMFFVEVIAGWLTNSAGLMADGLDMLADAVVYGLSLYAIGRAITKQNTAAKFAGLVELALATLAFWRVLQLVRLSLLPQAESMVTISILALIVNAACLILLRKQQDDGAHMKASYIFTANDVLANLGVILSGLLVALFSSAIPDLIIGFLIGILAVSGAIRILKIK